MRFRLLAIAVVVVVLCVPLWPQESAAAEPDKETQQEVEKRRYKEGLILLKRTTIPSKADVVKIKCPWKRQDKYCRYMRKAWKYRYVDRWGSVLKFGARALNERPAAHGALGMVAVALQRRGGCSVGLPYLRIAASIGENTLVNSDFILCNMTLRSKPSTNQSVRRIGQLEARKHSAVWDWYALAKMALAQGRHQLARHYLGRMKLLNSSARSHQLSAHVLGDMGAMLESLSDLEAALDKSEDDAETLEIRQDLVTTYLQLMQPKEALDQLDAIKAGDNVEEWVRHRRAMIAYYFEGDAKSAFEKVENGQLKAWYLFYWKLATNRLQDFPKASVEDLNAWERVVLAFEDGDKAAALDLARSLRISGHLSNTNFEKAQFIAGLCGISAQAVSPTSGSIADTVRAIEFKNYWKWRCFQQDLPRSFLVYRKNPRWNREFEIAWAAAVATGDGNSRDALKAIAQISDADSGGVHVAAVWTYAAVGDRAKVAHHLKIATYKGEAIPRDQWALLLSSVANKDLKQARADLEALPPLAKQPVVDPVFVGLMHKVIRKAASFDPVFATQLADHFLLLDGPLERASRNSLRPKSTILTSLP